jgi:phospholipase C
VLGLERFALLRTGSGSFGCVASWAFQGSFVAYATDMQKPSSLAVGSLLLGTFTACISTSNDHATDGGGVVTDAGIIVDAATDASAADVACAGPCPVTNIKYLVVIVQENHTFDDHFGRYCTATTGSDPTCTDGPACCEAAPARDPSGAKFVDSEDLVNGMAIHDPDHTQACELSEMNDGKMDRYATGAKCSDPANVAHANSKVIKPLWDLAKQGALADRWFQPLAGQSSANDIYFARAQFGFSDNAFVPEGAVGSSCTIETKTGLLMGNTIADLLEKAGVPWA